MERSGISDFDRFFRAETIGKVLELFNIDSFLYPDDEFFENSYSAFSEEAIKLNLAEDEWDEYFDIFFQGQEIGYDLALLSILEVLLSATGIPDSGFGTSSAMVVVDNQTGTSILVSSNAMERIYTGLGAGLQIQMIKGNKKGDSETRGSDVPVKEKTTASNGLEYQSNPKHTPGQPKNRLNAGIEPKNSLDLFSDSVPSTLKPNQRYTYDADTNTLHRFYNDGNGTWH